MQKLCVAIQQSTEGDMGDAAQVGDRSMPEARRGPCRHSVPRGSQGWDGESCQSISSGWESDPSTGNVPTPVRWDSAQAEGAATCCTNDLLAFCLFVCLFVISQAQSLSSPEVPSWVELFSTVWKGVLQLCSTAGETQLWEQAKFPYQKTNCNGAQF